MIKFKIALCIKDALPALKVGVNFQSWSTAKFPNPFLKSNLEIELQLSLAAGYTQKILSALTSVC